MTEATPHHNVLFQKPRYGLSHVHNASLSMCIIEAELNRADLVKTYLCIITPLEAAPALSSAVLSEKWFSFPDAYF
jgi:hypothetical protein